MSSVGHVRQVCLQSVELIHNGVQKGFHWGRTRFSGDRGANLVEYALLISLVALVAMAGVRFFGTAAKSKMDCNASTVQNESAPAAGHC